MAIFNAVYPAVGSASEAPELGTVEIRVNKGYPYAHAVLTQYDTGTKTCKTEDKKIIVGDYQTYDNVPLGSLICVYIKGSSSYPGSYSATGMSPCYGVIQGSGSDESEFQYPTSNSALLAAVLTESEGSIWIN